MDESGFCDKRKRVIKIAGGLSDEEVISTLLHEMVHASTNQHHGIAWRKEMVRLREADAPLCEPDSTVSLDDWDGKTVSRDHFQTIVESMLIDLPGVTLHQAIRGFIYDQGGPEKTIKGFLTRYPWARRVFQAAQKDRAQQQKAQQELRLRIK